MTLVEKLKDRLTDAAMGAIFGLLVGLFAAYYFYYTPPVVERSAPAVRQKDGSLIPEKTPEAHPVPKQLIPSGAKVERVSSATIRPKPRPVEDREAGAIGRPDVSNQAAADCPDVTVDWSLFKNADGTTGVAISSPDGEVIAGTDKPILVSKSASSPPKWAVGATYFNSRTYSARVERTLGPISVSAEALKSGDSLLPGVGFVFNF